MKKTKLNSYSKSTITFVLIAAIALCMLSCGNNSSSPEASTDTTASTLINITVEVVDADGKSTEFPISTESDNLGDALIENKLVEGENSEYGLYITTVNGITADYDSDGAYWALTKDGEYLSTGADSTPISEGDHFELKYTKA